MKPILTLTLNPALDIACATETVVPQHKLRTHGERMDPGGGGERPLPKLTPRVIL